jgi:gas vesicle protein
MGFKTGLLIGAAAGYVLGAKAGRERYEQIVDAWAKCCGDDRFQTVASKGRAVVDLATERVKDTVGERFGKDSDES